MLLISMRGGDVFMYRDSSAGPLLDRRRRIKAVMVVLDAMIRDGISLALSVELTAQWDEILGVELSILLLWRDSQSAWSGGLGEFRRFTGVLHCRLSDFIHRVVVHRRDEAIRGWRNWLREDPSSSPLSVGRRFQSQTQQRRRAQAEERSAQKHKRTCS